MKTLFWILILTIVYTYFLYPLFLKILSLGKRLVTFKDEIFPPVTLIVAAYNEEKAIEGKMRNCLELDYPRDKLEIIVASDASTDRTHEIVERFKLRLEGGGDGIGERGGRAYPEIILNVQAERNGKSAALNDTIARMAKGDVVIFTDATTLLKEDAIRKLVRNFATEDVGAVCGKIFFVNPHDSSISKNEGIYWRYEEFLRKKEGEIGILPFVSGAFYGMRRHLYTPVREGLPDDSVSPLGVYRKGYRVVFEGEAVAYEKMATTAEGEFRVKSRGVIRELGAILSFKELLNLFQYPLLSLVLLSHRLLRWSAGFFLAGVFIANLSLLSIPFYHVTLWCQIMFFSLVLISCMFKRELEGWRIFSFSLYFCLVNAAAMWGIVQCLSGKKRAVWTPVRGI